MLEVTFFWVDKVLLRKEMLGRKKISGLDHPSMKLATSHHREQLPKRLPEGKAGAIQPQFANTLVRRPPFTRLLATLHFEEKTS